MATKKTEAPKGDENTQQTEHAAKESSSANPSAKLTPIAKLTVATVWGVIAMKDIPALNLPVLNSDGTAVLDPDTKAVKMEPNPNSEIKLMRIAGFADGTKTGNTQYGQWHALTGEFAATNAKTGEIFAGKTAIVPGPMGEALVTATEMRLKEDASQAIRFSCDVFVRRSSRDPEKKYEYVVRPVLNAELKSPAMALLEMSE